MESFANQLIGADHYDSPAISEKRDQILYRWVVRIGFSQIKALLVWNAACLNGLFLFSWGKLKEALIEKRSKLGESQTLQQFSRDADEIENWIVEKLQVAQEESYKDPTNIQVHHRYFALLAWQSIITDSA